jgi:Holliday junction resolvasome RuvABC endonuclease subunit
LTCCGWALISKNKVIGYGKVATKLDKSDPSNRKRIHYICQAFAKIVTGYLPIASFPPKRIDGDRPDIMVLETFYGGSRHNGGNAIPEVRGALKALSVSLGLDFAEYAPQTVRKYMIGNGRAEKPEVAALAQTYLKETITEKDYDVTDAIVMGLYAAKKLDEGEYNEEGTTTATGNSDSNGLREVPTNNPRSGNQSSSCRKQSTKSNRSA